MMKLFSVAMLAAVANGQSFGPDADGWNLVMRHQTARYTNGGLFKRGQYRLNSADENAALYSIMDSIEDFRQDSNGQFTFKLSYPDICDQPTGLNADCIDDKNYITWNQTSNPYDSARIEDDNVDGYTPLDVAYVGDPNGLPFSGISYSGTGALFSGQKNHPNWWYAMGAFYPFVSATLMPAFRGDDTNDFGQYKASHMELHVWGPRKYEKASPLWKKVFKHNAKAGLWTAEPTTLTINSNDPSNNFFANLTDIKNYKHSGGKFVFKMEWPSLCNSNNNCDDGRNYIIWSQTSDPTTYTTSVEGYTALDVGSYNGANMFNGLTVGSDGSLPLRSTDTAAKGAWGVGATEKFSGWPTADSCSGCVPGPMGILGGNNQILNADEVTLYVFGDTSKINCKANTEYAIFDGSQWRCNKLTKCKSGTTFQTVSPTSIRDRVCTQVSEVCDADGQYQIEAPTLVNDRSCAALTQCFTPYEFAIRPPSTTTDRICAETTRCVGDEQPESVAPTATSDRVCGCGKNRVATSTGCTWSKNCTTSEFELAHAQGDSDTVCQKIKSCTSAEYLAVPSTSTSDAVCVARTVCDADSQMETKPKNATSDRVCSDKCTPCSDNSGLTTGCSDENKRVCQQLTSSSTTISAPTISSDGPNIKLSPGKTGTVMLDGSMSVNGVDLSQWLQSLQAEVLTLRSNAMEDKQNLETQRKQFTKQITQLQNQVVKFQMEHDQGSH